MEEIYKNRTALVTGAARGLGRLIALDFARRGSRVVIVDVREDDLAGTASEITGLGAECLPIVMDLSSREGCEQMIARAKKQMGPVDFLVNNAGVNWNFDLVDYRDEMIRNMVEINFMAQVWATRAVLPDMIERKSGVIVSIASGAAMVGVPAISVYSATKFALRGFFDSVRHELRKSGSGVRAIVVYPGYMDTKMFVGAKVPLGTRLFDPQKTSTALMKAINKGKDRVIIPRLLYGLLILSGILPPRLMEKAVEITGMHESFYTAKTVD